jgi:hypothetical protein
VHLAVVAALCLLVLAVVPAVQAEALRWLAAAAVQLAWAAQWRYAAALAVKVGLSSFLAVLVYLLTAKLPLGVTRVLRVLAMHCWLQLAKALLVVY